MNCEWDNDKNLLNIKKHGLSFSEASEIFKGYVFTKVDNRKNYGEIRKISIGSIGKVIIIVVVHTDRNKNIRIISARIANRKEREGYYEYIKKAYQRVTKDK